jgi:hypothetical protein
MRVSVSLGSLGVAVVAMILGVCAVYVPASLHGPVRSVGSPVFDWLFSAWKHCNCQVTLPGLFMIGLGLGLAWPDHWKAGGCSTMLLFPLFALIEIAADDHTHPLFPIEFAIDGFFTLFSLGGAAVGMRLRKRTHAPAV